jgi:hypothetical protein
MQTREKLAHRIDTHATLEAEGIERGDQQARSPLPPALCFPQPGLRMDIPTLHRLLQTMHTALRKAGLRGDVSNTLLPIVTKILENA